MKILFCTNSLRKGGAERVVTNLANYFVKNNDVAIILTFSYPIEYTLDSRIQITKLDKTENEGQNKIKKIITKVPRNFRRTKLMRKKIEEFNPDIIITFLPVASFLALQCKKYNQKKVIVSVRNDPKVEYKSFSCNFSMRKLYPKADGFVFQTKEAQDFFENIINCDKEIIPNPINPLFISEPYNGERSKEIVSVGRLTEQKNFDSLIEAFSKISNEFKDYKLIIYGEGEQRKHLEDKIVRLHMKEKILLPGVVDDVKEKIYKSAVFVLPSLYEGMPNALMEAMALGLPVISTDCSCGGPRELIDNEVNGLLVKVNDVDDLTNAIKKILKDKDLGNRLGNEANKIKDTLNPEIINGKWEKFIKDIANQKTN